MRADSAPRSSVLFPGSDGTRRIPQNRARQSTADTKRPAHVPDLTGTASRRYRQNCLAVEVVLHELHACVKTVADFGVVVDPVDGVFWHEYP